MSFWVFIVNAYFTPCSSVNFEQIIADWVLRYTHKIEKNKYQCNIQIFIDCVLPYSLVSYEKTVFANLVCQICMVITYPTLSEFKKVWALRLRVN